MFVKICGIRSAAALETAAEAGADAVGFVFAPSPRRIDPATAAGLCRRLPAPIRKVAVLHHPDAATLAEVLEDFGPDWLQTDAEDLDAIELPAGVRALPVYRSGRRPQGRLPERILFEGAISGSGRTADWNEARTLAGRTELILAGGLDADNVAEAIDAVGPWGVDVSSGVESSRGVKDPEKIEAFVARVRAVEKDR